MRKLAPVVLVTACLAVGLVSCGDDDGTGPTLDGTKIAFQSDRDGNFEIYVMDADGSDPVNLTNNPAYDAQPAWSPDGTRIAFHSYRDGNYEIYVMGADGSNPVRLTDNPEGDGYPAWSPGSHQR
jgi:Tol biopolymer transport system component